MHLLIPAIAAAGLWASANIVVAADTPSAMPFDTPMTMRAIEAVCTGIGSDARQDPRWSAYPLKVELAGKAGQLIGDAQVTLSKGDEALAEVTCGGPWVLFKVMPGAYQVKVEIGEQSKTGRVNVGATGQARIVMRFPEIGGATSPEYVPK